MGIFNKVFGKKKGKSIDSNTKEILKELIESNAPESNTPELFKIELTESLKRYYSDPELEADISIKDRKGKDMEPHIGLNHTFENWRKVLSVWDRRSVLFEHLDNTEFANLEKWQVIDRYVKDRKPMQALKYKEANIGQSDLTDVKLIIALSKMYRSLNMIDQSLYYAAAVYKSLPDLDFVRAEYASTLHLSDTEDETNNSHEIIGDLLKELIETSDKEGVNIIERFLFSKNYIDSSIIVLAFLEIGECELETWETFAEEYYYCPFFRMAHATELIKKKEGIRALAKLNSLAHEFPWYTPGVEATIGVIGQIRAQKNDPKFMEDEMKKLQHYLTL